ncbi:hypothetical protein [Deinococcus sp. PEB2-63]
MTEPQRFDPSRWMTPAVTPAPQPGPTVGATSQGATVPTIDAAPSIDTALTGETPPAESRASPQLSPPPAGPDVPLFSPDDAPPEPTGETRTWGPAGRPAARGGPEFEVKLAPPDGMTAEACRAAFAEVSAQIRQVWPAAHAVSITAQTRPWGTATALTLRNRSGYPLPLDGIRTGVPFELLDRLMPLVGHGDWLLATDDPAQATRCKGPRKGRAARGAGRAA